MRVFLFVFNIIFVKRLHCKLNVKRLAIYVTKLYVYHEISQELFQYVNFL